MRKVIPNFIPILYRPKIVAARNRWRFDHDWRQASRDAILTAFGIAVMAGIYIGTLRTLAKLDEMRTLAYVPPSMILGLVFSLLFLMLLISNTVSALGSLFLSRDLDLVLSSPVDHLKFYTAKLIDTFVSTSWMALVFLTPLLVAFGVHYNATIDFYMLAPFVVLPYFLIPAAVAVGGATVFTLLIPANRTREVLVVVMMLSLVALYYLVDSLGVDWGSVSNAETLLRVLGLLALPHVVWLPSNWAANCLRELLTPTVSGSLPYFVMLYSAMGVTVCFAYFAVDLFFPRAFSRTGDAQRFTRINSRRVYHRFNLLTPFLPSPARALTSKELKGILREMTQAVQLLMLVGFCIVYFYNLRILHAFESLPVELRIWWQGFLYITNFAMGSFIITAVCTRFVFPSLSLEGASLWVLQTSPLSLRRILQIKLWAWYLPVGAAGCGVLAVGAAILDVSSAVILVNFLASWIVAYGLVGIAMGFGAIFARFDWEHSSQLAASFGSLLFMLCATVLIAVDLMPMGLVMMLNTQMSQGIDVSLWEWGLCISVSVILLLAINLAAVRWILGAGVVALDNRLS